MIVMIIIIIIIISSSSNSGIVRNPSVLSIISISISISVSPGRSVCRTRSITNEYSCVWVKSDVSILSRPRAP